MITMQGAFGAQIAARRVSATTAAVAASVRQAPSSPSTPALGVPVAVSSTAKMQQLPRVAQRKHTGQPRTGQPKTPTPAATPSPPPDLPPPADAVPVPPPELVEVLAEPPSAIQPGIPTSLPSEGVAFVQSAARPITAAPSPGVVAVGDNAKSLTWTALAIAGIAALGWFAYKGMR